MTETPTETQAAIFKLLYRNLIEERFNNLEPEYKNLMFEETHRFLFHQYSDRAHKVQIIDRLKEFMRSGQPRRMRAIARLIIKHWNNDPL